MGLLIISEKLGEPIVFPMIGKIIGHRVRLLLINHVA